MIKFIRPFPELCDPKVVQEILGHSNISMTLDIYSHVLPSMHKEAMDKWNDAFGGG